MNRPITLLLGLAFSIVLALLTAIGLYWISSVERIDNHVSLITDNLLKKYNLTMAMREAARDRSLNMHRMIIMDDPFERDHEWLEFNQRSTDFTVARSELFAMDLSPQEREILAEQDEVVRNNVEVQMVVAQLALAGKTQQAAQLLITTAHPAQENVFAHLNSSLEYYAESLSRERAEAEAIHHNVNRVGWFAGGGSLLLGILVAFLSIRHINQGQSHLLAKEQEQSDIINGMMTGVMVVDEQGTIESFNHAASVIFGYQPGEIIGKHIMLLMHNAAHDRHESYMQMYFVAADNSAMLGEREVTAKRADGTLFPLRIMLSPFPISKDGKKRIIASCFDITAQKEQELRLRSAQKMDALGNLTGGIAHDYNNLLGIIMGYADLLAERLPKEDRNQPFVQEIRQAAERGSNLTKKLLGFARRKPVEESITDINILLAEDRMMLEKSLTASIRITMEFSPTPCLVLVDADDLVNAILNLCINAQHAMPEGGTLHIATGHLNLDAQTAMRKKVPAGEYVRLVIEDNGCGMDEATMSRIFEPFFSTKGDRGTGLGLSQVYGFVQRSGGDIRVFSTPGVGTRFEIIFPAHSETAAPSAVTTPARSQPAIKETGTILIVDDEPALLIMTSEMLTSHGYRVLTAANAIEAMGILEKMQVDLVLSDIIMPDISGFQLAAMLRERYPGIKIQLMSGYSGNIDVADVDRELIGSLLHKPFHAEALIARIHALMSE